MGYRADRALVPFGFPGRRDHAAHPAALWPEQPSRLRSDLQGLCAGDATSGRTRSAQGRSCALDQGTAGRLTPHMAEAIALIDYGAGNLHSVHNALIAAGAERVVVTADPALVRGARRI